MREIRKAAVIGAGVMGAGIAAHIANAGVPVVLLDVSRGIAAEAVEKLLRSEPQALMTPEAARLIKTAREVNDHKPHWVIEKVRAKAKRFKDPVIGCLGLAFKANIDDLRESPAMEITRELIASGIGMIMACEPNVNGNFKEFPLHELDAVLREADILLVLVDHDEFKAIDRELLKEKVVIDTRGVWR